MIRVFGELISGRLVWCLVTCVWDSGMVGLSDVAVDMIGSVLGDTV